ncbi:MAG: AIPR family protein [Pseudomonadota bacterium]|nr:AIPR family protein [Pseudomonadota bacterium]
MSDLHLRQLECVIRDSFVPHVDVSDIKKFADDGSALSRGLAAFTVSYLTGIDAAAGAAAVVDGFDDNGIDAVYFDATEPCLYLIQSKWQKSGKKGVQQGDITSFLNGFRDLVDGRFDRFNDRLQARQDEVLAALNTTECKYRLVFSHTSTQKLSVHAERAVADLLEEMNDISELVFFQTLSQLELYNAASRTFDSRPIDVEIMLQDWGLIEEPYKAYYGHVDVEQVAKWWSSHGNQLFDKNLRRFLGDSQINASIGATLRHEARHFWYFNNGITILCSGVQRKMAGGGNRRSGVFTCKGISVVNGAQTVGTIGRAKQLNVDGADLAARVFVRLVSLENCPEDFAVRVTKATNTQNRIQPRDFVALDPEQQRLSTELQFLKVKYSYKSGEPDPLPDEGFTIEDASVALACSSADAKLAMIAKGFVGKLWEDVTADPYRSLFTSSLTGEELWRRVRVYRRVERALDVYRDAPNGVTRGIAVHGNRFLLRQVFRVLRSLRVDPEKADIEGLTHDLVKKVSDGLPGLLEDTHLAWTFKTVSKYRLLENRLFNGIRQPEDGDESVGDMSVDSRAEAQLKLFR